LQVTFEQQNLTSLQSKSRRERKPLFRLKAEENQVWDKLQNKAAAFGWVPFLSVQLQLTRRHKLEREAPTTCSKLHSQAAYPFLVPLREAPHTFSPGTRLVKLIPASPPPSRPQTARESTTMFSFIADGLT
jgi:hypothetical protein